MKKVALIFGWVIALYIFVAGGYLVVVHKEEPLPLIRYVLLPLAGLFVGWRCFVTDEKI